MRLRVPPGCTGLTFQDGSRASARSGVVEVDERHARAIRKADPDLRIHQVGYTAVAATGRECGCGFMAWIWQQSCPRCGAGLTVKREA